MEGDSIEGKIPSQFNQLLEVNLDIHSSAAIAVPTIPVPPIDVPQDDYSVSNRADGRLIEGTIFACKTPTPSSEKLTSSL